MDTGLDGRQRATLRGLADVLMPARDGLPSAGAADAGGDWLARVLAARPDLVPVLRRVLDAAADRDPAAELARLRAEDPPGFLAVATAVTGGYHMNPAVRAGYGYPGRLTSLPEPGEAEHDLRDDLLAPVVARGPIYRQAN